MPFAAVFARITFTPPTVSVEVAGTGPFSGMSFSDSIGSLARSSGESTFFWNASSALHSAIT